MNELHLAAAAGSLDRVKELPSSNSIDLDALSQELIPRTALHYAADAGHASVVAQLLSAGANSAAKDANGYTALHSAVNRDALDTVNALLAAGADPNARCSVNATPLHLAAYVKFDLGHAVCFFKFALHYCKGGRCNSMRFLSLRFSAELEDNDTYSQYLF